MASNRAVASPADEVPLSPLLMDLPLLILGSRILKATLAHGWCL
jgi:hypothetical protein